MTFVSYRLHRKNWLLWSWVADYRGQETRKGFAMSETSARGAARSWLRARGENDPEPEAPETEAAPEPDSPPH